MRAAFLRVLRLRWAIDRGLVAGVRGRAAPDTAADWEDAAGQADRSVGLTIFHIARRGAIEAAPGALREAWTVDTRAFTVGDLASLYEAARAPREREAAQRAGGQVFTPSAVARVIVDRTLGEMLRAPEGMRPAEPGPGPGPRVLDPACGAGHFLLEAFDVLYEHAACDARAGVGAIETILAHGLHGMDLDGDAVEEAVVALALRALERCPGARLPSRERWNLRAGDALDPAGLDAAGFEVVVGNPPYVPSRRIAAETKRGLARDYVTWVGEADLSVPFLEAGLRLLADGGRLGYLISNKFMCADYGLRVRRLLLERGMLREIADVSRSPIFRGAAAYPVILVAEKPRDGRGDPAPVRVRLRTGLDTPEDRVSLDAMCSLPGAILTPRLRADRLDLARRILAAGPPLPEAVIRCGIARAGFGRRLIDDAELAALSPETRARFRRLLQSGDVLRFALREGEARWASADETSAAHWAHMTRAPKLLVAGMGRGLRAAVDQEGLALGRVYYVLAAESGEDVHYLAALYNSDVLGWLYALLYWSAHLAGGYLRVNAPYLARMPVVRRAAMRGKLRDLAEEVAAGAALAGDAAEREAAIARLYGLREDEAARLVRDLEGWNASAARTLRGARFTPRRDSAMTFS